MEKKKPSRLDQLLAEKKATEKAKKPEDVKAEILKAEEMKKKLELAKKAGAVADSDDSSDDSSDDDEVTAIVCFFFVISWYTRVGPWPVL